MSIKLLASLVSLALVGCVTDQQAAIPTSSVASPAAQVAAQDSSWNGTWVGGWSQGSLVTPGSFTVVNNRLTEYLYKGTPAAFDRQEVTPTGINFGSQQFIVQIARAGPTTASAYYKGSMGTATGTFTRQ